MIINVIGNSSLLNEQAKFRAKSKRVYESLVERIMQSFKNLTVLQKNSAAGVAKAHVIDIRANFSILSGPGRELLKGQAVKEKIELTHLHANITGSSVCNSTAAAAATSGASCATPTKLAHTKGKMGKPAAAAATAVTAAPGGAVGSKQRPVQQGDAREAAPVVAKNENKPTNVFQGITEPSPTQNRSAAALGRDYEL